MWDRDRHLQYEKMPWLDQPMSPTCSLKPASSSRCLDACLLRLLSNALRHVSRVSSRCHDKRMSYDASIYHHLGSRYSPTPIDQRCIKPYAPRANHDDIPPEGLLELPDSLIPQAHTLLQLRGLTLQRPMLPQQLPNPEQEQGTRHLNRQQTTDDVFRETKAHLTTVQRSNRPSD
jgi:hypothetical protein